MHLRLIRHATLRLEMTGRVLLLDPRLEPPLPEPPEVVVKGLDAVLVTSLHDDHLDATARRLLPRDLPLLCRPPDEEALRAQGFARVLPVEDETALDGLRVVRTVSGFVLAAAAEPSLYIAGDTVWCDEVRAALDAHRPHVVVLNGGAARSEQGDRFTMTADDVVAVARHAPSARVVVVHLEAVSHSTETRADLHQRLHEEGLADRVTVPEDGAEVPV
jgi:L-ascorbate metabolism protein UlaG (beta-lactamase superfamily)